MTPVSRARTASEGGMGGGPPTRRLLLLSFLLRRHDRTATFRRATAAGVKLQILLRVLIEILVLIIVGELRPRRNALDGLDPDVAALDVGVAVRIARVVDEAR